MSVTTRIADRVPNIFGLHFVSCVKSKIHEPQCLDMCALHSGACQVLCGNLQRCWSQCQPGSHMNPILDRSDVQSCVDSCLVERPDPTPPDANSTWPNTKAASFPPETRDDQPARESVCHGEREAQKRDAGARQALGLLPQLQPHEPEQHADGRVVAPVVALHKRERRDAYPDSGFRAGRSL